jgi:hypothetical protein
MTPNIDSIMVRVQKLLALAGNNPNEAEATLAMQRAQELLAQHNLTLAQINENVRATGGSTNPAEKRTKEKLTRSAMFKYQRRMWEALAKANFCEYMAIKQYHSSGIYSNHMHFMVGREDNVTTVKLMGEYLESTVNRLCPYKSGKEVNQWKEGCSDRICERLTEKVYEMRRKSRQQSQQPATGSTALVVMDDVYERETHGNYVFQNGNDRWCPCRNCRNRRDAEWKAQQAAQPPAPEMALPEAKETDAQRRKREEREERQRAKWREQWQREQARENARRNAPAYRAGQQAGDNIGLDSQVTDTKKRGNLS